MIQGYDVSNVNGGLSITQLSPPAEFVIAKVSQDAAFVDTHYARHKDAARTLEIGFGGYHYGDNVEQPDPEASCDFFLEHLGEQLPGEIAALDVEKNTGDGGFLPGDHADWVYRWGARFLRQTNYKCKLYVSDAGITDFGLNKPAIADVFDLWYAYWLFDPTSLTPPSAPAPWTAAGFKLWQYNADGVDKDRWLGTLDELKATGKQKAPNDYESSYWTPMQALLDSMLANSSSLQHADQAFHATVSNAIVLHKVARAAEPG